MTVCISCKEPHTDTYASVQAITSVQWHDKVTQVINEMLNDLDVAPAPFVVRLASAMCADCVERVHAATARTIERMEAGMGTASKWSPALFQWKPVPVVEMGAE
jgi:malonyl CoA-acyl carrier protein transacylase